MSIWNINKKDVSYDTIVKEISNKLEHLYDTNNINLTSQRVLPGDDT